MLGKVLDLLLGKEPVVISGLVAAVLGVAVAFGTDLTPEQVSAITALAMALAVAFARQQVVPTRKLDR